MHTKKRSSKKSILDESFSVQALMKGSDSYKSLIYGIVTVVVLFVVIALGIRSLSQNRAQIDNEAVTTQSTVNKVIDDRYTVVEGDSLWSISEKTYNDGYSWHVIAEANNITDPGNISAGTKLVIPSIKPTVVPVAMVVPTASLTPAPNKVIQTNQVQGVKITESSYVVQHGDNLWNIAVRAYGDGYRWTDIANQNKLANPGLIFSGNSLAIPRP